MPTELYEFADVTVDLRRVEVRRAGEVVPLEPKSFDVLRLLLEHRDRLVTKDELLDAVWKDTFVTPNVLTRAVAQLRKGLGDDAFEARYIETVAKRGYRFIGTVAARDGSPATAGDEAREATPTRASRASRPGWLALIAAGILVVAGAAATRTWLGSRERPSRAHEEPLLTPRRLTDARRASYIAPTISPDGSAVAYASARSGSLEIYVAGLAPGSREIAITSDGNGNGDPAFSPDGQWLAYSSGAAGGIWVVPATGGAPRRVTDFGTQPAWSPDSQTIVFTSRSGLSSQAQLWTVRRDGTAHAQLTKLGDPPGGHAAPAWSHDGERIAFMVGRHEEREIWLLEPQGGRPRRLASLTRFSEPLFAPDDRAVYWLGLTAERNDCLMRLRLSPRGEPQGDPERVLTFQGEGVESLSVARGGRAVFHWARLSVNLFAVDLDSRGRGAGPPRQLTFDEDAINRYVHYAQDGRLAYEQVVAGRPITAWVMDEDGGNATALSAGLSSSVRIPQWERGARRLFTLVEPERDEPRYYAWLDVATRELVRIPVPSAGADNMPSLSRDGQRLAYHLVGADGVLNVWVQPLDGGAARQVTFDREAISYPRWSPDGGFLVVAIKRGQDIQLGLVPLTGGPVEQLTSDRGVLWGYAAAPDGERVAFARTPHGTRDSDLYVVSRRTRESTRVAARARFPAFSPRGDRIVFSQAERTASLWTIRLPVPTP